MLRLEEIDETSETGTFDGRATDFVAANEGSDCSFAGAAISSSAARNLAEEGFGEMMSASSPTPTTSGDFSLEAVEDTQNNALPSKCKFAFFDGFTLTDHLTEC